MAQVGYGAGLLLVVPLCDLFENRRLVFLILCVAVLALLGAAVSTSAAAFLAAAALIGLGSVAVQILVPYAAHLAPDASRGRVVGNVMSGLMLGIMLARPAASLVTQALSWRAVFVISSGLVAGLAIVLWVASPQRQPAPGLDLWRPVGIEIARRWYMATFFGGGAIGSALGGWSYAEGGWPLTMAAGLLLPVIALAYFLTEPAELQS